MDLLDRYPLDDWLSAWGELWGLPDLDRRVRIVLSGRMRRGLGRCFPRTGEIRLNRRLWDEPLPILREVLCHEAAHVAVERLHGPRVRPHGTEWKSLMRQAGFSPRARMDPARLSETFRQSMQPRSGFLHQCPACGASRVARRAMRRWRCGSCHRAGQAGRLRIVRLPAPAV